MSGLASPPRASDQSRAATRTAAALLQRFDVTVLDTETTDLHGRIVQIGAVDLRSGDVLFDEFIDPAPDKMAAEATAVCGITDAQLASKPRFAAVAFDLRRLVDGTTVVAYNASYDREVVAAEYHRIGSTPPQVEWVCAMQLYREWLDVDADLALPGGDHTALGDCRAVRALLTSIAAGPPDPDLVAAAAQTISAREHDDQEAER